MIRSASVFNSKQLLFKEVFVGTLIYAVVLAFFNDYTSLVYAKSFSTIFYASIVLEVLTYLALFLKDTIIKSLIGKTAVVYRIVMFFCVWLVMFISKFIFVWVIDLIFGSYINIKGFFGILSVVVIVTLTHKVADRIFIMLGDNK